MNATAKRLEMESLNETYKACVGKIFEAVLAGPAEVTPKGKASPKDAAADKFQADLDAARKAYETCLTKIE